MLGSTASTPAERQAARDELARLLMNPGAKAAPVDAPKPPRAAVAPLTPSPPLPSAKPAQPKVTPVAPPVRAPSPVPDGKGGTIVPSGKTAIDPATGAVLVDTGNGWVDPATGRFVPARP